ncbi:class I SAM-dependent methyltransferase [Dactylosporangium sp. CA-092794]|uniref:class I SAM-dependent methyltransferase n=1 Tax=Dactylosporangium sp. CA-092794 TaxID=3239929 RepID=UPI003D8DC75F
MADRIAALASEVTGRPLPVRIRAWDGSESGPSGAAALVIRDKRALRRLLWQPNELGLARAYVGGELDVDGDLYEALASLTRFIDEGPYRGRMTSRQRLIVVRGLIELGAVGRQPAPPPEEARLRGRRHSMARDNSAISHHYDVGNDFYRRVLGPSMVYSCAYWASTAPGYRLEDAQFDKLELICRKLGVESGTRLLDVGCGWGALAIHAAKHHGAQVVGVTLSEQQAAYARQQVADLGLEEHVDIRVKDYRNVDDGPYDAISSVGMAEHVGVRQFQQYTETMYRNLRVGGRFLNHQIAQLHPTATPSPPSSGVHARRSERKPTFIGAYVFPDGELRPVGTTIAFLEAAGFEVRGVEAMREHYGRTLRAWVSNLETSWEEAVRLTTVGRTRVWRLYMAACALAFEAGRLGVNQVLCVKPHPDGRSEMPSTPAWLSALQ